MVLAIEEATRFEFAGNSRFPPEDAFAAAFRSCHDHAIELVKKIMLTPGKLRERSRLVDIVAGFRIVGGRFRQR